MQKPKALLESGYIALISVLIMSALLITITAALSSANYFSRYNILENEFKEHSSYLAEACVNYATGQIAGNTGYTASSVTVPVGQDTCSIASVTTNNPVVGQSTIITQGVYPKVPPSQSYTNLKVVVNTANLKVVSWQESPN
jgi:hypothetical protein